MTAYPLPIPPPDVITQEFRTPRAVRRGVVAGVVGNMLEWYDFALFGFFAQQIGAHFFPAGNPTASLLAAFGTFAAGFVMRPVGGALFGWVGDRYGRKQALIWSVLAMAFPSFFIGLLPGTETIGLAAPVLLLLFRMLQGLAVGGEYMASAVFLVEGSQPGRRGWMGSWGPLGASAGTLLGSMAGALVNRALPPEAVMAYGWRIPFLVGLAVGLGGLAIRRHYVERVPHQAPAKSPLGEAFRHHWRTMLHLVSLIAGMSVGFYTIFVYSATWLEQVGVPARTALEINTLAMAAHLPMLPAAGWLSGWSTSASRPCRSASPAGSIRRSRSSWRARRSICSAHRAAASSDSRCPGSERHHRETYRGKCIRSSGYADRIAGAEPVE